MKITASTFAALAIATSGTTLSMSAQFARANEVVFACSVLSQKSTMVQTTDATAPFAGMFIGNYEVTTNPLGTRTIPGYFGGSGNNAIPYTASFVLAGDIATHPMGTLIVGVDSESLQIRVSNLALDLLGGQPGVLGATININYTTFHTVAPNAIYPGGVTIPIPVGNGSVSTLRMTQTGNSALGLLVPNKDGSSTFTIAVPVDIVFVADLLGTPISDGTPTPGILPLTGTLVEGSDTVVLSLQVQDSQSQVTPLNLDPFVDQPLALPTIIPTGGTANLLLSGDVTELALATTLNATLKIAGERQAIIGDLNGDSVVNAADLSILLSNWGTAGPGDLDGSGTVNAPDLSILLSNWS